jgi:hypothetical protein
MAQRRIVLKTEDGCEMNVNYESAAKSQFLLDIIDDYGDGNETIAIPLPFDANLLESVMSATNVDRANVQTMLRSLSDEDLERITMACNHLHIECLLQECIAAIASRVSGMAPLDVISFFNLE